MNTEKRAFGFSGFAISSQKKQRIDGLGINSDLATEGVKLPLKSTNSQDSIQSPSEIQEDTRLKEGQEDNVKILSESNFSGEGSSKGQNDPTSEEEDPLDAFMATVERDIKNAPSKPRARRDDFEDEDDQETFFKHLKELDEKESVSFAPIPGEDSDEEVRRMAKVDSEDSDEMEYDSDDNPIPSKRKKKEVLPIPALDHSSIEYSEFRRDFFTGSVDALQLAKAMSDEEINALLKRFDIRVAGLEPPSPVANFQQLQNTLGTGSRKGTGMFIGPVPTACVVVPSSGIGECNGWLVDWLVVL